MKAADPPRHGEGILRKRNAAGSPSPPALLVPLPVPGRSESCITFIPARPIHVGPVAARLRDHDRIECAALGQTPRQALRTGLAASSFCLTVLIDGRAEAMLGLVVTNALYGEGRPWMLGTDALYRQPRALLLHGPPVVATMLDSTPRLSNLVACGNSRAIRFLRRLGFIIDQEVIVHTGIEFVAFTLEQR